MFKSKVHLHLEQHTGHLQLTQSRFSVVYVSRHKFTSRLFVLNLIKNCLLQILLTKVTYKGYLFTHENTLSLYTQCNHLQCHENALAADNQCEGINGGIFFISLGMFYIKFKC